MSIFELNKIMISVSKMYAGRIRMTVIEDVYNSIYYSEQTSKFIDVLDSALCFGLLNIDNNNLLITDVGRTFVNMMPMQDGIKMLDGTNKQKRFLLKCINTDRMHKMCGNIFKKFRLNYYDEPPTWNLNARAFNRFESCMFRIFEEIGIVGRDRNVITVRGENVRVFSALKNGSQIRISDLLDRRQEIGDMGESMTVKYEMKRLANIGRGDLSDMVKQVSMIDPYAGYDIASFDGRGSDELHHDRLIEVKSTTSTTPKFFWSHNEVVTGRMHGKKYWIYLWTDVEGSAILHKIKNPYVELFETGEPKPKPSEYVVNKSVLKHAHIIGDSR